MSTTRLAIDIGGTFTDFALQTAGKTYSRKLLTTPQAPEEAVLEGTALILRDARLAHADLDMIIHGTTLATNAIIERKGAKTALLVTQGFRDSIEMAYENRFEQYDIFMERPEPLVPRNLRLPVPERIDARGTIIDPLDENAIAELVPVLRHAAIQSVAIGFLHSYVNPVHEQRAAAVLGALAPDLAITTSSAVSPEMREYERWSTACANAYVQPVMDRYLSRLEAALRSSGMAGPIFLITSAGGLTTVDLARRFPIRLVESGPAGGAILAAKLATQYALEKIVSFDMGGTTAKICLIDDGKPLYSRSFEVARQYRFLKGSGIPIRIPVIEMVEIGAGGGSIASVDEMTRIQVGPHSAGSEPGPACYGRGGTGGTVTDADLVIGRIRADRFAGGAMRLDREAAQAAIAGSVGTRLELDATSAALGIVEVVEENMANAARVHAVESGKELSGRAMVAFGGAAPLHAARLAEKLDIDTVIVPTGAGVGSAVGFLLAPIAYEVARTHHTIIGEEIGAEALNELHAAMRAEAEAVIRPAEPNAELTESWTADMRYVGQGHELAIVVRRGPLEPGDAGWLKSRFLAQYEAQFGRVIPDLQVEILSWSLRLATPEAALPESPPVPAITAAQAIDYAEVANPMTGRSSMIPLYGRDRLVPGNRIAGPALIVENETTTMVTEVFTATINGLGHIILQRSPS
jgi:N-methylhydantoinase A